MYIRKTLRTPRPVKRVVATAALAVAPVIGGAAAPASAELLWTDVPGAPSGTLQISRQVGTTGISGGGLAQVVGNQLSATAARGFHFVEWDASGVLAFLDGNTSPGPHSLAGITGVGTAIAVFMPDGATAGLHGTFEAAPGVGGTATIQTGPYLTTLMATAAVRADGLSCFAFSHWEFTTPVAAGSFRHNTSATTSTANVVNPPTGTVVSAIPVFNAITTGACGVGTAVEVAPPVQLPDVQLPDVIVPGAPAVPAAPAPGAGVPGAGVPGAVPGVTAPGAVPGVTAPGAVGPDGTPLPGVTGPGATGPGAVPGLPITGAPPAFTGGIGGGNVPGAAPGTFGGATGPGGTAAGVPGGTGPGAAPPGAGGTPGVAELPLLTTGPGGTPGATGPGGTPGTGVGPDGLPLLITGDDDVPLAITGEEGPATEGTVNEASGIGGTLNQPTPWWFLATLALLGVIGFEAYHLRKRYAR